MWQLRTDVHVELALTEKIQVIGKRLPLPSNAFMQRSARNVFNAFHQFDQQVVIRMSHRCEPHAAVTHDHGGNPMMARRRHAIRPRRLTIIMGVNIDKAGRYQATRRIDLTLAGLRNLTHPGNSITLNGDIRLASGFAATVDYGAVADDDVVAHQNCSPCPQAN